MDIDEQLQKELSTISEHDYKIVREELAAKHKIDISLLDDFFNTFHSECLNNSERKLDTKVYPWPVPVNGETLLNEIYQEIDKYVSIEEKYIRAIVLWIVFTYRISFAEHNPFLCIISPIKGSGKTLLMSIISKFVERPFNVSSITPSSFYRSIDKYKPTLFIDESDNIFQENHIFRTIVNSAFSKSNSSVMRSSGKNFEEVKQFSTFCPLAFALIGNVPPTIHDRSIIIIMYRKKNNERKERFVSTNNSMYTEIKRKIKRFVNDHSKEMVCNYTTLPANLENRNLDKWEELICIADCVGGDWPNISRQVAEKLVLESNTDDPDICQLLLMEIDRILKDYQYDRISSQSIIDLLGSLEEGLWSEYSHGRKITKKALAELLKPFGIHSIAYKSEDHTIRGYWKKDFQDILDRYC